MTTPTRDEAVEAVAAAFKRMHSDTCYPSASDGEAKWAAEEIIKAYKAAVDRVNRATDAEIGGIHRSLAPAPTRDEAVREHADRYHKRPFTGFAPRDEKRRKQVVSLPMDVLLAIFRERLAYLQHGSDLDAVAQFVACEIERAMGVFPNLDAPAPAPASGGVDAVGVCGISADTESKRVLKLHFKHEVTDADRKTIIDAFNTLNRERRSALSPAATPVSEAGGEAAERSWRRTKFEFIGAMRQALINSGLTREQVIIADNAITEAFSDLAKPASSPAGGDVREALQKLYDGGVACHDLWFFKELKQIIDALSQSTSAGRVG